ncbi:beta-glucosidase A [Sodiomyces alkalinus F11]|uniref:beta-glucosidase n=1 Tax=Sodiomyces alkalinus (strain CBS 110278 / VKM F-3762 / F11) TaxID=1314773 RepID=A0A3N2PWE1_SODAK|nr:beta-glucosidase A [Sodiomyces alkalinus F11]ROT38802.1 beta-glucosidase A [Sodiomyces alkalinus F11]
MSLPKDFLWGFATAALPLPFSSPLSPSGHLVLRMNIILSPPCLDPPTASCKLLAPPIPNSCSWELPTIPPRSAHLLPETRRWLAKGEGETNDPGGRPSPSRLPVLETNANSFCSYQVEGSPEKDGRGPTIWDEFCKIPGKIADGSSGAVACDSYNRTAEDISLIKSLGANCYRFSLAWSRIIPLGGRNDPINQAGIDHYVKFVDDLLEAGITPFITLLHWDVPDALDKRYGGLLNREEFPLDFENYARVVYKAIPKCKNWITFNEPWCSSILGYSVGAFAPGRTSNRDKSPVGDSSREPWIVGHNLLVAHGRAVKVYREEFKPTQGGQIGITLNGDATYPWDPEDPADVEAANRKIEFAISWFADPVYFGKYPDSMRKQLGDRLPEFTEEERALVQGSNDFYGMNHYTANYVRHKTGTPPPEDYLGNLETLFWSKSGECIGPETESPWLRPNPQGFRNLINWLSKRYNYPPIYVTENGTSILKENDKPVEEILEDTLRVEYFDTYVKALAKAVSEDGCNVKGYMAWSLLDNFEWAEGYVTRFGVTYVDYEKDQKRFPKKSAQSLKPLFDSLIKKD